MYVFEFRRKNWAGKNIKKLILLEGFEYIRYDIDFLVCSDNIDVTLHLVQRIHIGLKKYNLICN